MHPWHTLSTGQVLEQLRADPVSGLAVNEAAQRLQHYGPNQLKQPPQPSWALRFLNQVKDPMVLVLLAAAALSLLSSRGRDWLDAVIILVIVVVNGIISISQEDRAQQALEELRKMTSPHATALRGGAPVRVEAAELVPGDVILLAGKGHETEQEIGTQRVHLDEREEIASFFQQNTL